MFQLRHCADIFPGVIFKSCSHHKNLSTSKLSVHDRMITASGEAYQFALFHESRSYCGQIPIGQFFIFIFTVYFGFLNFDTCGWFRKMFGV